MRLNLGSWIHPKQGYVNVDIQKWWGVDVVCDLNKVPWQWKDASVDEVRAIDIIEHLGKLTKVEIIEEIARIVKPGGLVVIRVPCASHCWALASLQHAHSFQYNTFEQSYAQPHFRLVKRTAQIFDWGREFTFNRLIRWLCKRGKVQTLTFHLVRNESR